MIDLDRAKKRLLNLDDIEGADHITNNMMIEFLHKYKELEKSSKDYCKARYDYRSTLVDVLNSMTSRKTIYANKTLTMRNEDIFKYNKSDNANIETLFRDEKVFEDICEFIRNEELEEKFRNTREIFLKNNKENIGVYTKRFVKNYSNNGRGGYYFMKTKNDPKVYYYRRASSGSRMGYFTLKNKDEIKSELQNQYLMSGNQRLNMHRPTRTTKRQIVSNFNKYKKFISNAIEVFNKTAEFYEEENKKLKSRFKTEIILEDIF